MPGLIETPALIWVAVAPVDMRRGPDGLSAIVQQSLGHSPCVGSAFILRNHAGYRLRLWLWDGNGVWLCQRRLLIICLASNIATSRNPALVVNAAKTWSKSVKM